MVHASYSRSDSARETPLANALAKLSGVCDQLLCSRPGRLSTGSADWSWASGRPRIPLNWAGEMTTQPRASPMPTSRWAMRPPKECPTMIGRAGRASMVRAYWLVISAMPRSATASGLARVAATVAASPGQPGAMGW
jgi:hypothetical protein